MSQTSSQRKDRLRGLSQDKAKLVKLLLEAQSSRGEQIERYPRDESNGRPRMPVSWAQQRLWFIDQLEGGSSAYHIAHALRLKGELDELALQSALDRLVQRHEMLRTVFVSQGETVQQEIGAAGAFELSKNDLSAMPAGQQAALVKQHQIEELHRPFNLGTGPLIRGRLLRLHSQEHVLLFVIHHIAADGWSLGVMLNELQKHYSAFHRGEIAALEPLAVQYADYAQWQRQWLRGDALERQLSYWQQQLKGAPPQIELPTDRPRPTVQSYRGENARVVIDAALTAKLKRFAQRHKMTLFMTLYAGWACLLSRLSGQQDVVIGTPVANRQRPELEPLIGFFVNTLVLRVDVDPASGLAEYLEQVKATTLQAYEYQDVPFEQVVERLQPERSLSRNPLFQVMFALQNAPASELEFPQVEVTLEEGVDEPAMFDLLVSLYERGGHITGSINYAADLFDRSTIERWIACFKVLLESLADEDVETLSDLRLLPEHEREHVLRTLNSTSVEYPREKLVHELFESQVALMPDAVAVEFEGRTLTYAQLNARSNRLARGLREHGVGPDRTVAVCLERGLDMVVAVLGALKAGGAYLPLDPNYPSERLEQMVEDARPAVLLTQTALREKAPVSRAKVIELDALELGGYAEHDLSADELGGRSEDLVYVIYTSGSTGRPKGTGMAHRSMINLIEWHRRELAPTGGRRVLQFAALSFDVAFQETFTTLCLGGTLVLVGEWVRRDARALSEYLSLHRIQRLFVPPLMLQSVAESCLAMGQPPQQLEEVITAGEQLRISAELRRFFTALPGCRLHNHYGPTETHVVTSLTLSGHPEQWPALPAIGRPIANTQIYILDGRGQPTPLGVSGEIYIGGANVARGYLHRAELTEQRFLRDPFNEGRMYKTGDVGRWRADGTIEYLGRNDDQVKIRGFRVELGEIETQLSSHEQVKEAAVVTREEPSGAKRLVAYYVPKDAASLPSVESLRTHVKERLPEHMVPSAFVHLERLPLTPTGKLDRRSLPAPQADAYVSRTYEAPKGEVEQTLAGIWQELLKVQRVGRHDNFFHLGGHSLLIVQMMERLRRVGLAANVRSIYQSATLADLAQALRAGAVQEFEAPPNLIPEECEQIIPSMLTLVQLEPEHLARIEQAVPGGARNIQDIYPLAPLQEGILFHHLLARHGADAYVVPLLLRFESRRQMDDFGRAMQRVIDRHDVLRTCVLWEQLPRPIQVVHRRATLPIEEIALDESRDPVEQLKERMQPEHQWIDLRHAPLLRMQVTADPRSEGWFAILQLHHIVSDHESLHVTINEAIAHLSGAVCELPPPVPYRNHVAQALAHAAQNDTEAFFSAKLGDVQEPTAPFGLLDVHGDGSHIGHIDEVLERDLAIRLRRQAGSRGVSAATLFHAAWALVLAHTTNREDLVFGAVLLGRLQSDAGAQQVLGMFINTLPLRLKLHGKSAQQLIEDTQRELLELLNHEQTSLAIAQRCSGVGSGAPLFTTLLNYRWSSVDLSEELAQGNVQLIGVHSRTNYPITLGVMDKGDDFVLEMETDRSIDHERLLSYVRSALESLVRALESSPQTLALDLEVTPQSEREKVLRAFNETQAPYPQQMLVHELFEAQALRTPEAVAVEHGDVSLTYAQLNAQANRVARYLRGKGVRTDRPVAVCFERGAQMVVGVLAAMKAGGAYVPLDPNYPSERLEQMVEDAAPAVVLTQAAVRSKAPGSAAEVVVLEEAQAAIEGQSDANLSPSELGLRSEHLVYVIYTSGSTGRPKGTGMAHRSMVNLIEWHRGEFPNSEGARVLQFAALSFDVAFQETFSTLCLGGTLVLVDEWVRRDARALGEYLNAQRIDRLFVPPLMLQSLAESYLSAGEAPRYMQDVITAGEQLRISPEIVSVFQQLRSCRLHNHYGPTETHVVTALTLSGDPRQWPSLPSIGGPIANTQIYVLDARMQPAPIGVAGEVYIAGANLARGYLHRAELTKERFVRDPFGAEPHARMYKTGDLGRWRADGTIEYLGRNDDQVKIRGFRIELGEIEAKLAMQPLVKEAAVVAREETPGQKRLVAYVTPRDAQLPPSVEDLRTHLKSMLPEHMVPSAFVQLERLPLTPSGKLDRRALPAPDSDAYVSREYEAPQSEVEELLAGIWAELLKIERVGRHDNFFELGGHSLMIVQMMERLRKLSLGANVRSIYQSATLADLARVLEGETVKEFEVPPNLIPEGCTDITPQMLPLLELEAEDIEHIVRSVPGGAANVQDIYPLTPLQEGMLFHHLANPHGRDIYARPILLSISSPENLARFAAALQHVIDRHDVLRTVFRWKKLPQPVQVVQRAAKLAVDRIVLEEGRDIQEQLTERINAGEYSLDLARAPLARLEVAAARPGEPCFLVLVTHHLVFDNQSIQLLLSETIAAYEGAAHTLPKALPFRNHVAQSLTHARRQDSAQFFRSKLGDVSTVTAPFGISQVGADRLDIRSATGTLDRLLGDRIRQTARRLSVSVATVLHAAWSLVLSYTSGRDDVVFGSVLLGRFHGAAGAQRILGMFINTLPLRLKLSGLSARELIDATQRELIELLQYEQASLADAQKCSAVAAGAPLFTALINFSQGKGSAAAEPADGTDVRVLGSRGGTNYPIVLSVRDQGDLFQLNMDVRGSIDPDTLLAYLSMAVLSLVQSIESASQTPALSLPILPEDQRERILRGYNTTAAPYPREKMVHEIVEEWGRRTPDAVAVSQRGESVTYAEVNRRADQLARLLRQHGVAAGDRVGLCFDRCIEMVIGILASMKSGAAYVPLDPNYPPDRLAYLIEDSAPSVVLTKAALRRQLPPAKPAVIAIDQPLAHVGAKSSQGEPLTAGRSSEEIAYVIYTSGSTGRPKGVMVSHRNIVNYATHAIRQFDIEAGAGSLVATSMSFDLALTGLFPPLLCGRAVRIVADDEDLSAAIVSGRGYAPVKLTPTHLSTLTLPESGIDGKVRALVIGGELLQGSALRWWREHSPSTRLFNHYGPTETTIGCVVNEVLEDIEGPVPIGRPISNTSIYVLNAQLVPVPEGVVGEIYIGGDGVASGYWSRPELTAERFVADPFRSEAGARMYRVGDLGRWRGDGTIEFLGRNDDQVKIRGFRIELGEVGARLMEHAQVKEAVVLAREDVPGEKRLVAYLTTGAAERPPIESLRAHARALMPDYMTPSAYVVLERLPLTQNGKLDKRALPPPDVDSYVTREYAPAEGAIEGALADLWRKLLKIERVGRHDNFFELGGHSLHSLKLVAWLEERLGVRLPTIAIFQSPTIRELAELIEARIPTEQAQADVGSEAPEYEEGAV